MFSIGADMLEVVSMSSSDADVNTLHWLHDEATGSASEKKQWMTLQYIAYIALILQLLASKIIVCGSTHQMFCSTTIGW